MTFATSHANGKINYFMKVTFAIIIEETFHKRDYIAKVDKLNKVDSAVNNKYDNSNVHLGIS